MVGTDLEENVFDFRLHCSDETCHNVGQTRIRCGVVALAQGKNLSKGLPHR